ncbi:MAG: O-antigen ligase family protein [bacterium JZ-2024 1]
MLALWLQSFLWLSLLFLVPVRSFRISDLILFFSLLYFTLQSILFSHSVYESLLIVFTWSGAVWMYILAGFFLGKVRMSDLEWAVDIISTGALLSTLYGLFTLWGGDWSHPLTGTFYWHNPMAAFLVASFFPFFTRIFAVRLRAKFAYALSGIILILGLFLTRSRGGIISFVVATLFYLLRTSLSGWSPRKFFKAFSFLLSLPILVFLLSQIFPGLFAPIWIRFVQFPTAIAGRWAFWKGAWFIFLSHPLLGIGWGNFPYFFPPYQPNLEFFSSDVHNILLQFLAEGGLVSTFLAGLFLLSFFQELRSPHSVLPSYMIYGVEASIVGALLHSMIDFDWLYPSLIALLFFWFGLRSSPATRISFPYFRWILPSFAFLLFVLLSSIMYKDALYRRGLKEWREGKREVAYSLLKRASALLPPHTLIFLDAAQMAYVLKNNEEGLTLARKGVESNPVHPVAHQIYAKFLWRYGDLKQAEQEFRKAVLLDPWNRPYLYRDLALFYLQNGNIAGADEVLENALKRYPFRTREEVNSYRLNWQDMQMNQVIAELHLLKALILEKTGRAGAEVHRQWAETLQK